MRLTFAGWLFLGVAWTCIGFLASWCMVRLVRKPQRGLLQKAVRPGELEELFGHVRLGQWPQARARAARQDVRSNFGVY